MSPAFHAWYPVKKTLLFTDIILMAKAAILTELQEHLNYFITSFFVITVTQLVSVDFSLT